MGGMQRKPLPRRTGMIWVLALVVALVPTIGSSIASAQTEPIGTIPLLSRVVGYVEDADGIALEGIDVEVTQYYFSGEGEPPSGVGTTGADGEFSIDIDFTPPDGGAYQLRVMDPDGFYGFQVTDGFFIQPGYDHVVGITMVEGGTVSGTVSSGGSPLADVCVDVYRYGDDESIPVGIYCSALDGSYDTGALDPGEYAIVASAEGYLEAFQTVVVTSGDSVAGDLNLEPRIGTGTASVTVDVVSADDGAPVSSCVYLSDSLFLNVAGSCSPTGTVTLSGLEPGTYAISVNPTDGRHLSSSSITPVTLTDGGTEVEVAVSLGGAVEGTVTEADGTTPLAGVRVQLCSFSAAPGARSAAAPLRSPASTVPTESRVCIPARSSRSSSPGSGTPPSTGTALRKRSSPAISLTVRSCRLPLRCCPASTLACPRSSSSSSPEPSQIRCRAFRSPMLPFECAASMPATCRRSRWLPRRRTGRIRRLRCRRGPTRCPSPRSATSPSATTM